MPKKSFKAVAQNWFPESPLDRLKGLQSVDPNTPWLKKLEAAHRRRLEHRRTPEEVAAANTAAQRVANIRLR